MSPRKNKKGKTTHTFYGVEMNKVDRIIILGDCKGQPLDTHKRVSVRISNDSIGDKLHRSMVAMKSYGHPAWTNTSISIDVIVKFDIPRSHSLRDIYTRIKNDPIWGSDQIKNLSATNRFTLVCGSMDKSISCRKYRDYGGVSTDDVLDSNIFINDIPIGNYMDLPLDSPRRYCKNNEGGLENLLMIPSHVKPDRINLDIMIFECSGCGESRYGGDKFMVPHMYTDSILSLCEIQKILSDDFFNPRGVCYWCYSGYCQYEDMNDEFRNQREVDVRSCMDRNIISNSIYKVVRKWRGEKLIKEAKLHADLLRLEPDNLFGKNNVEYIDKFGITFDKNLKKVS